MNFIIIVSDTLRRDHLGCYGNQWISTPHIDRFARQSLLFLNAYCASFPTVPHRRDLLTGRYTAAYTGWAPLSGDEIVLPEVLRHKGYITMMICDTPHILANGYRYDRGFDGFEWIRGQESDRWKTYPEAPLHPCDPAKLRNPEMLCMRHRRNAAWWQYESDHCVARTMTEACRWLEKSYRRERFLLYVDTFDPHEPWDAPDWYVEMYDPDYKGEVVDYPMYAFSDFLSPEELRHVRALYAAEVTLVDRWIGRLLEKIEDLGLLRNTMVILTTDHGFLHGEHRIVGKSLIQGTRMAYVPLYEEICHIPLIIHCPGCKPGKKRAMVQPMDLMPTILELAGLDIPERVNGRSFAHVLGEGQDEHRGFAVSSPYLDVDVAPATVTCGKWAAVIWSKPKEGQPQPDRAVDGFTKIPGLELDRRDMLFSLDTDVRQQSNVAAAHPEVLQELRAKAVDFWRSVGAAPEVLARWAPA